MKTTYGIVELFDRDYILQLEADSYLTEQYNYLFGDEGYEKKISK